MLCYATLCRSTKKIAEFHADFKSVKKVLKMSKRKLFAKMWRIYALFPLYSCSSNLFCLKLFFACFKNFFNGLDISMKFWVFSIFLFYFIFFKGHISTFFKLWRQTGKKLLQESKKIFIWSPSTLGFPSHLPTSPFLGLIGSEDITPARE